MFPADLVGRRRRYDAWVCSSGPVVHPVMKAVRKADTIALDSQGMSKRGWNGEPPLDWSPPQGTVLHGGYGEDRAIYDTPIFNRPGETPRTVHLGIDLFAAPDAAVFCPLNGQVHSIQRNDSAKDYGPTLILEHGPERNLTFYTLYGHLAEPVLERWAPGDPIAAGETIAEIGPSDVNGGWAPHLHFQVMLDMLGRSGDFPGVCQRGEADAWLALCPDPAPFLGLSA